MIKSYEATGKTVEAAKAAALKALGLSEDDVSMEVLVLPKSGFLGIGAVPAKVRVSYEAPDPKPEAAPAAPKAPKAPRVAEKSEAPKAAPKAAAPAGSREERVENFLRGLLEHMDVSCEIAISQREGGGLDVKLDGPNMGAVIGRRGETLDAIQHLVNYAINRGGEKHMHINVDAEDYRSKREESLVHLAEKMAAKALKYKRSMALEPMNSYERHVIHTALQNFEGVSTSSIGTEPNRRVVVNYERSGAAEEPRRSRGQRDNNRRPSAPKAEKVAVEAPKAEPVKESLPADFPEGYTPPTKNKPQSREWC